MAADEAAQCSTTETDAPESAPANDAPTGDDVVFDAWTWSLWKKTFFLYVCQLCFGFVNLISQQFLFNLSWEQYFWFSVYGPLDVQTMVMARCFWALIKVMVTYLLCLCDYTLYWLFDMLVIAYYSCIFVIVLLPSLQLTILQGSLDATWALFWFVARFLSPPPFFFFLFYRCMWIRQ